MSERTGGFAARMDRRVGLDGLAAHLQARYRIQVTRLAELDLGVFRVDRRGGPGWVARVFPAARPVQTVDGDAQILRFLADHEFPAERCAATPAVTVHAEQGVLVTEHIPGRQAGGGERVLHRLGDLLGRLHTLPPGPGAVGREGGGWHHLVPDGGPRAELDAALSLLAGAAGRVPPGRPALAASLRAELERADDGHGLPSALIHPDFVPANAITSPDGGLTLVDWAGAGRGPRLWSLAFLLWAAAARDLSGVDAVLAGYLPHVRPEPDELARLAAAVRARPLVFGCWAFCAGRRELADVASELPFIRDRADAIAARATAIALRAAQARAASSPPAPPITSPSASVPPVISHSRDAEVRGMPVTGDAVTGLAVTAAAVPGVATTGVAVAAVRAAETRRPDRLFADPLAAAFVAASGWTPSAPPGDRRVAALRAWIVARTVFLDELVTSACRDGCLQVVLLGAGYDARAFRLPWPPGVRCFELDTADVLDRKARVLEAQPARAGCDRLTIACDLRADWPGALLAAGFTPGLPTAWVAEGLLVYLEPDDVEGIVADLSELSAPGSRLGLTMSGGPVPAVPAATAGSVAGTGNRGGPVSWNVALRRSTAPADPVRWLAGHGWPEARVSTAADVLGAHGREDPPRSGPGRSRGRRGLLIDAAR